jgi:large subunit ribosomal protein L29
MINTRDIRKLNLEEISTKAKDLNEEIFKLKMQKALGTLNNKRLIIVKRRELAQIYTIINEKLGRNN